MGHRKTKVMWLIKGLGVGGAEQLLANSVPYLDRSRFSYEVAYVLPWKTALVDRFAENGIPVFCIRGQNPFDPRVIPGFARLLKDRGVDILDCHLPYSGVIGRLAAKLAGVPSVLYTEHSLSVQRRLTHFSFAAFTANVLTYFMNNRIITVSKDTYQDVQRFNFTKVPMQLVYNGINLDSLGATQSEMDAARSSLQIPTDHKIVGHVATMSVKKSQVDLLQAAKLVVNKYPKVTFLLVGQGPLLARLRGMVLDMGLQDNVILPGFVDDLRPVFGAFDIFALSSLHEGLPTVTIEALGQGIPVVATDVGGTPEIVTDGIDGFLTRPRDPAHMAEKLLKLLQDDDFRHNMGQHGRDNAYARFDIKRRVKEVEAIYSEFAPTRPSLLASV